MACQASSCVLRFCLQVVEGYHQRGREDAGGMWKDNVSNFTAAGPRELPIQCYIRRDRATSTYFLHIGLTPSEFQSDKLLLAARKIRRATCTDFVISLKPDNFSRSSNTYFGKMRSNFLGTKFTIYDGQLPHGTKIKLDDRSSQITQSKQGSSKVSTQNYKVGTITYELNVLRSRGPRRMNCVMHAIPMSSIEKGGTAPTPTSFHNFSDKPIHSSASKVDDQALDFSSTSLANSIFPVKDSDEPLMLKNKPPRWHEQLQCWCLNFKGRVTVASVKNFQLAAAVEPSENVSADEQERVILQFGKIGKDIFTMDYSYPLSAFQAFAICLTSFDNKPACE
uniref:Tubby C-terminal domain-containing protein n=1 Tax=Kalanchoe fedtschenkoi TaxID=63787 RepID=A0A7N0VJX1_KALFE